MLSTSTVSISSSASGAGFPQASAGTSMAAAGGHPHHHPHQSHPHSNLISHLVSSNSNSSSNTSSNSPDPCSMHFNLPPSSNTRFGGAHPPPHSLTHAQPSSSSMFGASGFNSYAGMQANRPTLLGTAPATTGGYMPSSSVHSHMGMGGAADASFKVEFEKLAFFEFIHELVAPFRLLGIELIFFILLNNILKKNKS